MIYFSAMCVFSAKSLDALSHGSKGVALGKHQPKPLPHRPKQCCLLFLSTTLFRGPLLMRALSHLSTTALWREITVLTLRFHQEIEEELTILDTVLPDI